MYTDNNHYTTTTTTTTTIVDNTSGSGYPVITHSSRVWLPSSTVRLSSGCTKSGLTGLRAPALTAAVSTAGASTSDSCDEVLASPPMFFAITVYDPQSSLNTSPISRLVEAAFTMICPPQTSQYSIYQFIYYIIKIVHVVQKKKEKLSYSVQTDLKRKHWWHRNLCTFYILYIIISISIY